ncbi:uncharacterized protein LOC134772266 [Penaeus indicus]|uniref:uncharacterized protein LOC134772266 n=1 Tax=Penaeus indicus TaxID=29960 RepID=UPI00300C0AA7
MSGRIQIKEDLRETSRGREDVENERIPRNQSEDDDTERAATEMHQGYRTRDRGRAKTTLSCAPQPQSPALKLTWNSNCNWTRTALLEGPGISFSARPANLSFGSHKICNQNKISYGH